MICLNALKLTVTAIGGALILGGRSLRNENIHLKSVTPDETHKLGIVTYFIGWLVVLYALISDEKLKLTNVGSVKHILQILAVILIVGMTLVKDDKEKKNESLPHWLGIGYVIGWIVLGLSFGLKEQNKDAFQGVEKRGRTYVGLTGALLILLASFIVIPKDRKTGSIDGLGSALLTIGLTLIVLSNSVQFTGAPIG